MYDHLARYYDLTHAKLTEDIGFLLTLAAQTDGPILELGCGTGRLLIPLARAGHHIVGLDNSPAMLAYAHTKITAESPTTRQRITLHQDDMLTFQHPHTRYPLIIIPYNTFMHIPPQKHPACFKNIYHHLAPQGTLCLDLTNPHLIAHTPNDRLLTLENIFTDPQTGHTVTQMASNYLYEDEQRLQISWLYDASPPQGGPLERLAIQMDYHYQYPHQLELSLQQAKLKLANLYGHYNRAPFDEDAPRLLILATR
ncbi:MAG TPA: methyltransferase domain-containing protein [Anaerolineae bacterium]|nr:methyltransferase domain-containing protein [Anaerolineae bacterium]